ncbi:MAG: hypothetical protein HFE45_08460 [Oscillospiraceae bacterium]|nr:hypothetical protein [Oscillospiraceae bacterium]
MGFFTRLLAAFCFCFFLASCAAPAFPENSNGSLPSEPEVSSTAPAPPVAPSTEPSLPEVSEPAPPAEIDLEALLFFLKGNGFCLNQRGYPDYYLCYSKRENFPTLFFEADWQPFTPDAKPFPALYTDDNLQEFNEGQWYFPEGVQALNLYRYEGDTLLELLPESAAEPPCYYRGPVEIINAIDGIVAEEQAVRQVYEEVDEEVYSLGYDLDDFYIAECLSILDAYHDSLGLPRQYLDKSVHVLALDGDSALCQVYTQKNETVYPAPADLGPDAAISLGEVTLYEEPDSQFFLYSRADYSFLPLRQAYAAGLVSAEMAAEALNLCADERPWLYRDETTFRVEQILNRAYAVDWENGRPIIPYNMLTYYRFQQLRAAFEASPEWPVWQEKLRDFLAVTVLEMESGYNEALSHYLDNFDYALQIFIPAGLFREAMKDVWVTEDFLCNGFDLWIYEEADIVQVFDGFGISFAARLYPVQMEEAGGTLTVEVLPLIVGGDSGGERPLLYDDGYTWLGESWRYEPTLDEVRARYQEIDFPLDTAIFKREGGVWKLSEYISRS